MVHVNSTSHHSGSASTMKQARTAFQHPSTIPEEEVRASMAVSPSSSSSKHHSRLQRPEAGWPKSPDMLTALARCEDASLSWSLQFWVTLADPVNQTVFFANPATGQCSWEPPVGAYVVPRSPDGEWWELADSSMANRSYYYNTVSGKTQWTRPEGDVMVIPLGLIQNNSLPAHSPPSTPRSAKAKSPRQNRSPASNDTSSRADPSTEHTKQRTAKPAYAPEPTTPTALRIAGLSSSHTLTLGPVIGSLTGNSTNGGDIDSKDESRPTLTPSPSWLTRLGIASPTRSRSRLKSLASPRSISRPNLLETGTPGSENEGQDVVDSLGRTRDSMGRLQAPERPIQVAVPVKTKRLSTGLHPILPTDISSQIKFFQADNFAERYFATRRTGFLRQKVPVQRVMQWQKNPITTPLLVINRTLWKDATLAFKVIQTMMRDRTQAVDGIKSLSTSTPDATTDASGTDVFRWEGARWLVQLGASSNGEIRDEVYCQLMKQVRTSNVDELSLTIQLIGNRSESSIFLGFQLLCVLVVAFGPSKNFEPYVRDFLQNSRQVEQEGISVMAKYCLQKLEVMSVKGGRGKSLTQGEIKHAADAAYNPSIFGESLPTIMHHQESSYPDSKIPIVLPFLANGILALNGLSTEGAFRVSGDGEIVAELKAMMDQGHYQLAGIDDPHVLCSLFKLFLRDLETPLIPSEVYNEALEVSANPTQAVDFVKRLPAYNRRVLLFVISFLQLFLDTKVVEETKMTPQNLALVMAPNILRTTSDSLPTVINNASFEAKFILQLLKYAETSEMDTDYVPTHPAVEV